MMQASLELEWTSWEISKHCFSLVTIKEPVVIILENMLNWKNYAKLVKRNKTNPATALSY